MTETQKFQEFEVWGSSYFPRRCKACKSPLSFYQSKTTNRWIPFDDKPEIRRQFLEQPSGRLVFVVAGIVHFATCPAADRFRRRKPPTPTAPKAEQGSLL